MDADDVAVGHVVEDVLDDGGRRGDDTGGDRKGPGEGFAEKVCIQECGLGLRLTGRTSILVWPVPDDLARPRRECA